MGRLLINRSGQLGKLIKAKLVERSETAASWSKRAKISPVLISRWVSGERIPRGEDRPAIAKLLEITVAEVSTICAADFSEAVDNPPSPTPEIIVNKDFANFLSEQVKLFPDGTGPKLSTILKLWQERQVAQVATPVKE